MSGCRSGGPWDLLTLAGPVRLEQPICRPPLHPRRAALKNPRELGGVKHTHGRVIGAGRRWAALARSICSECSKGSHVQEGLHGYKFGDVSKGAINDRIQGGEGAEDEAVAEEKEQAATAAAASA